MEDRKQKKRLGDIQEEDAPRTCPGDLLPPASSYLLMFPESPPN
jgi:hypothetical protein